jgi:tetratricopeptide (TPR) repeat protein
LLETIRAFAAERLAHDGGEMQAQTRHAAFFHALGESAAPRLWQPQQQVWFDRLEREHDNLRAALQFWLDHGKPGSALRLATSLAAFWEAQGHLEEGLGWLNQALAAAQDADPASRGRAMFSASRLAGQRGDAAEESVLLQDSLSLFRLGGDLRGQIFALSHLGNAAARRGEASRVEDLGAESVARARELADPWYLAMALNNYGYSRVMDGNVDSVTEKLLAESLQLRRSLDEKRGVGFTLGSLAELQLLRGDLEAAASTLEEMLTLSDALTHAELTSVTLNLHGFLYLARGDPAQAARVFQNSLQRSWPLGFQLLVAEALLGCGEAAAQQGAFTRALRFAVAASRVLTAAGQQPASLHRAAINRIERHVEQAIDQPTRQVIRTAAETATLDQVLAEAAADAQD